MPNTAGGREGELGDGLTFGPLGGEVPVVAEAGALGLDDLDDDVAQLGLKHFSGKLLHPGSRAVKGHKKILWWRDRSNFVYFWLGSFSASSGMILKRSPTSP